MIITLLCGFFLCHAQLFTPGNGLTDIDGNSYSTIIINGREWMSENLKTTHYANNDEIPYAGTSFDWQNTTSGLLTYFNNDQLTIPNQGIYYNGYAVIDQRNVCPSGWHVPTRTEWVSLFSFLDSNTDTTANASLVISQTAGGYLKALNSEVLVDWNSPNQGATNNAGFTGIAGGMVNQYFVSSQSGQYGYWWSSTPTSTYSTRFYRLAYDIAGVYTAANYNLFGFTVRCISDNITTGTSDNEDIKTIVYPNPAYDRLFIISGTELTGKNYIITDHLGRIVLSSTISQNEPAIDISYLPEGVYLLSIGDLYKKIFIRSKQ